MGDRVQIVVVYQGKTRKFRQYAEGESRDEFRGRAICAVNMPEGAEYYSWEDDRGCVGEHSAGMHRVYHLYGQDDRLPGTFYLRGRKVVDIRGAVVATTGKGIGRS